MRAFPKSPAIVEVDWLDSETSHNWRDRDGEVWEPATCRSIGYLVRSDKKGIRLSESVDDNGNTGCTTSIPKFAIRNIRTVRKSGK